MADNSVNRENPPARVKFCTNNFKEFTSCTSLHGFQYLGQDNKFKLDKLWWLFMIILSFMGCTTMIYKVYMKWVESPVIVSFSETATPVWQIPFPAITICSQIRVRQTLFNFTDAYYKTRNELTEEEWFKTAAASILCNKDLVMAEKDVINRTTMDFLKKMSPPFDEIFVHCGWRMKEKNCNDLFTPFLTEVGICYTFNTLAADEIFRKKAIYNDFYEFERGNASDGWTIDGGFPQNLSLKTYPKRGLISGPEEALYLVLNTKVDDIDYLCTGTSQGFRIAFQSPSDFPRITQNYFNLPIGQELVVSVKPKMITTSSGLTEYDPHRRQCYVTTERKLKFFRIYTQQNCQVECLTNYTMDICGCVAFWMPRDNRMAVCSNKKRKCMDEAKEDLQKIEIKYALALKSGDKLKQEKLKTVVESCDCLPGCTSINYHEEISQSDFPWKELVKALKIEQDYNESYARSNIKIFFKDADFIPSRRSELYGVTDFLANCGGILGLFLGFSFLSLVEIGYFLIVKPIYNFRSKSKKLKSRTSD